MDPTPGAHRVLILALLNVFGQRATTSSTTAPAATLAIRSPDTLRSGLVFQTRLRILATAGDQGRDRRPSPEWIEGITFNTIEPSPIGEASKNGSLSFDLGHIPQGQEYSLYIQMQVNPTTFGSRRGNAALRRPDPATNVEPRREDLP